MKLYDNKDKHSQQHPTTLDSDSTDSNFYYYYYYYHHH